MRNIGFAGFVAVGVLGASSVGVLAETSQFFGAGSAVTVADRSATFDALSVNGTPISDYTEGGLFVGVDGDSWIGDGYPTVFDPFHIPGVPFGPFHCPYGGSAGWVNIHATDGKPIFGLEFLYGNGWTTGDIYGQYPWGNSQAVVEWQTWSNGALVSSGIIGDTAQLPVGTVLGFYDASGFDVLLVKCTIPTSGDPTLQVLALDNLTVQLKVCAADYNNDGFVDPLDYNGFINDFEAGSMNADFNRDGFLDPLDYNGYINAFEAGC